MKKSNQAFHILIIVFAMAITTPIVAQQKTKPNILFIAVDDLKPILGCYGDKLVKTPNIDRLAKMGTVFQRNYCQQAVCGPTRASIMTGKRPDNTGVWDLKTRMRDVNPDILSLPQYLISQGYSTQGIGKIYDSRCVDKKMDAPSWSVPYYNYFKTEERYYPNELGAPLNGQYQSPESKELAVKFTKEARDKGMNEKEIEDYVSKSVKPAVECIDVPDNAYNDGANAARALEILEKLKSDDKPFFFAVGFSKPHLPFVSPKKYWDLYKREDMPVAPFQEKSKNSVDVAYHNAGEIRAYTDIPPLLSFTDQKDFGLTLPIDKQKELIHGYYAAVSYTDAQVGKLLDKLEALGLTENTIIVLWGDHGWHLGDHNLWCKHTNFEQATRTPLIIAAPGIKATTSNAPSEFVDVFPTLCDLAGVKIPETLDGKSLKPLMNKSAKSVKDFSISQYPRSGTKSETERQGYASSKVMGYSLRDERYRYTIWMTNDFKSSQPFNADLIVGTELFDYDKDPNETVNVIDDASYKSVAKDLKTKMINFFKTQVK
jgi:arylsulfatase A-like enzyme